MFIYALSNTLLLSSAIALLGAVVAAIFVRTHHAEQATSPAAEVAISTEPAISEVAGD